MIRLTIVTTRGEETNLAVDRIITIDGQPFDAEKFKSAQPLPPEDRLTELESRIKLHEAAIGFIIDRTGIAELPPEGAEPPADNGDTSDGR